MRSTGKPYQIIGSENGKPAALNVTAFDAEAAVEKVRTARPRFQVEACQAVKTEGDLMTEAVEASTKKICSTLWSIFYVYVLWSFLWFLLSMPFALAKSVP